MILQSNLYIMCKNIYTIISYIMNIAYRKDILYIYITFFTSQELSHKALKKIFPSSIVVIVLVHINKSCCFFGHDIVFTPH